MSLRDAVRPASPDMPHVSATWTPDESLFVRMCTGDNMKVSWPGPVRHDEIHLTYCVTFCCSCALRLCLHSRQYCFM
eukprot:SAG11_NODE_21_length_25065_cov_3.589081_17_plen_77_part_00